MIDQISLIICRRRQKKSVKSAKSVEKRSATD